VKIAVIIVFARRNLPTIEAIVIIFAIIGAAITLAIGGSVRSDTIRIIDASSSGSPPYGELSSSSIIGYDDNFSGWTGDSNARVNTTRNFLLMSGAFENVSTWTAVNLFKNVNVNITSYPILNADVNLTVGVRFGIRFYAQYANGTEYDVWWEGSPVDHRPGSGFESLRINMQREAFLATGHSVESINRMQLYVEDQPYSSQTFQFILSKLSFENDVITQVTNKQYNAVYYDLRNPPQENASWHLDKINIGVMILATQGSTFSVYVFNGPVLYASTTATGQSYNPLTPVVQITFYPNIEPQIFPELLPLSGASIVFVATSGNLQRVTMQFANFEFLPTATSPDLTQHSLALYYLYFIFFLFLLPLGVAILVFREFLSRNIVPRSSVVAVLLAGILCRIALATTTAHVFDMNVYLTSIRGWFQYRTPVGSFGPTLPFTFFLYWVFYSPYELAQFGGFQDVQFVGHAAGLTEAVFVKLFPIVMDLTTFFLLLRFGKTGSTFVWATFYLLNPMAIFASAVWGQYEAATTAFIAWGFYWMSRQKSAIAALSFIISGMIELFGFLPYLLLLLRTARMKSYRTLSIAILALLPAALFPSESIAIFRLFLGFVGLSVNSGLSQPGRFTLIGNFSQLSIVSQFQPLLLSETLVLGAAILDTYRQKMTIERLVLYTAVSCIPIVLFSNLIAFWFWLLPTCLLYVIMREKNDLGAFMLVFGTCVAFLEAAYAFGSSYLILGVFGAIVPSIEGIKNTLKILSIMVTALTIILLLLFRYGKGQANQAMLRTSAIALSIYLLLYFWFGVYSS
jgi:hypothetical protein